MFQPYLLVSYVSSSKFPAVRKVLTFQVPKIILFLLARILHQHTSHLRPGAQRKMRSLLTRAMTDPVWAEKWLSFHVAYHGQIKPGGAHSSRSLVWVEVFVLLDSNSEFIYIALFH